MIWHTSSQVNGCRLIDDRHSMAYCELVVSELKVLHVS